MKFMDWCKKESSNYIFHYQKGSLAEKHIDKIIELQEICNKFISNSLKVKMKEKIKYYLCSTPEEVGEVYGDNEPCNGFNDGLDKIYAVYNKEVKCVGFHEDAHIISYNTISRPKQAFLREGLAMFYDKVWWGIPNYAWAKYFLSNGIYLHIKELLVNDNFYKHNDVITYPVAGAFVEYLILSFGIESFKTFYSSVGEDFDSAFKTVFDYSIKHIEDKFIRYIDAIGIDEAIYDLIKVKLREKHFSYE
ncbi:hypothetical protein M918_15090 [Clostridium sp. BL8]|nr:hypothetical protein M918_15090 [Clostridium sp. BL8]